MSAIAALVLTGCAFAGPGPTVEPAWSAEEREQFSRGVEHLEAGRWAEGAAIFEPFVERYPGSVWAHNDLGACRLNLGEYGAATRELLAAERLDPNNLAVRTNLAFLAARTRDLDGVVTHVTRRRAMLFDGASGPGAESSLTEALQLELAEAYRALGERAASIAAYESGMAEFPARWWFPEFLALHYVFTDPARARALHQHAERLTDTIWRASGIAYRLPIDDRALVLQGHAADPTHRGAIERWAWDFVPLGFDAEPGDAAMRRPGTDGTENAHYFAFGTPVLAVADGVVLAVVDADPDNPPNASDDQMTFGNGVLLSHTAPDGQLEYSIAWHLKHGSIRVRVGDAVSAGDVLGEVGNSGISKVPHLHFVVRRGPGLGVGLDARFASYRAAANTAGAEWRDVTDGAPTTDQLIEPR